MQFFHCKLNFLVFPLLRKNIFHSQMLLAAKGRLSNSAVLLQFSSYFCFALPEGKWLVSSVRAQTRQVSLTGSRSEAIWWAWSLLQLMRAGSLSCAAIFGLSQNQEKKRNNSVPVAESSKYCMSKTISAPNAVVLECSQLFPRNQPFSSCHLRRWAGNREGCDPAQ